MPAITGFAIGSTVYDFGSRATQTVLVSPPVLPAAAQVGQTVTANDGVWDPQRVDGAGVSFQRRWLRAGTQTLLSTAATYVVTAADVAAGVQLGVRLLSGGILSPEALSNVMAVGVVLRELTLSAATVPETATPGTVVGTLDGLTGGSQVEITDDAGGRFTRAGTAIVVGLTDFDYLTAPLIGVGPDRGYAVQVTETLAGAAGSPRVTTLTIRVANVLTALPLQALTLTSPDGLVEGAAPGVLVSAIERLRDGSTRELTDDAGGRFALSPAGNVLLTGAVPTDFATADVLPSEVRGYTVRLTETLLDAPGSPRVTEFFIPVRAAEVAPELVAPTWVTPPSISGDFVVGGTLTRTPGVAVGSPEPVLTGYWTLNGQPIPGATGLTYVIKADDAADQISARGVATNTVGSVEQQASVSGTVLPPAPALVGPAIPDQTLTQTLAMTPLNLAATFSGTDLTYSLAPGSAALPAGLSITNGILSGAPTSPTAAPLPMVVRAQDPQGRRVERPFWLAVNALLSPLTLSGSVIAEDAAPRTLIGTIGGRRPGSTLALVSTFGDRFAREGTDGTSLVVGANGLDYALAPLIGTGPARGYTVQVRETMNGIERTTPFTVRVLDVADGWQLSPTGQIVAMPGVFAPPAPTLSGAGLITALSGAVVANPLTFGGEALTFGGDTLTFN